MLIIDGSQGEGGGQILRSSLALSLLTKTPIQIHKIRASRKPKPGLQAQHLACVRGAAAIGRARVDGDQLGSSAVFFAPEEIAGGQYRLPIRTAGATSLALHTVFLPLSLGTREPSRVVIEGGTHVERAPSFHFLEQTWLKAMSLAGLECRLGMKRPGFYPRGGGEIEAAIAPARKPKPLRLIEPVSHQRARVVAVVAGLVRDIGTRLAQKATTLLRDLGLEVESSVEEWPGGPACLLMITLPDGPIPTMVCGLGSRGKPADVVATETVAELKPHLQSGAPVDPHTADQLLLPLAFATGESQFRVSEITGHLLTNAGVIEQFGVAKISVDGEEGCPGSVRIQPNEV